MKPVYIHTVIQIALVNSKSTSNVCVLLKKKVTVYPCIDQIQNIRVGFSNSISGHSVLGLHGTTALLNTPSRLLELHCFIPYRVQTND